MSTDTRKWTLDQATEVAHAAGFVGESWFMTPEELAHVLNTAGVVPPAPPQAAHHPSIDVRTILLEIVPGDGNGQEVYAKSVDDVVAKLTELSERAIPAAGPAVPEGWLIEPCPELSPTVLVVRAPKHGPGSMTVESDHANLATRMLYCLASDLIAADRENGVAA